MNTIDSLKWKRSSKCTGGTCVEVAKVEDGVLIRDGKNPQSGVLAFTAAEWLAFTAGVKAQEFDL